VQLKGVLGLDPLATRFPGLRDLCVQVGEPLLQGAPEGLLLGAQPGIDRIRPFAQLGVCATHHLSHALAVATEEARLQLERPALQDRTAHHASEHVSAILVRRHHTVGHEKCHRAAVVGQDPQRAVGALLLAIAPARQLLAQVDQGLELVGFEHRFLALQDRRHAVESQARVDVVGGQIGQG
jgi:hypothetical protein